MDTSRPWRRGRSAWALRVCSLPGLHESATESSALRRHASWRYRRSLPQRAGGIPPRRPTPSGWPMRANLPVNSNTHSDFTPSACYVRTNAFNTWRNFGLAPQLLQATRTLASARLTDPSPESQAKRGSPPMADWSGRMSFACRTAERRSGRFRCRIARQVVTDRMDSLGLRP